MKIVHAADLHIDSPLKGLERYEGAPYERVRGATRASFENIISLCISERARFLVLAGDIFDSAWKDYNTGLFFVRQLIRLRDIGCDVVLLRGNHDFELTRTLRWPEHVHEFGTSARGERDRSFAFDHDGVVFHGVSYASQKVLESLLPHYPQPVEGGMLNIGVLHTNATGSSEHDAYAPCTVKELVAHGYDYWALGHVHGHAILAERPWVVYPGNSQGRHARETGPKGCVVLDVQGGAIVEARFVDTSVMRWSREELELGADDSADDLVDRVRERLRDVAARENSLVAIRLIVTGGTRAHAAVVRERSKLIAQIRTDAMDSGLPLWLEKIELLTSPVTPIGDLREAKGLVAELLERIEQVRTDEGDAELLHVARALDPLRKKLGGRELDELGIRLDDPEYLRRLLGEAEALLAERLTDGAPP